MIECALNPPKTQTAFGPLCALGHFLTEEKVLEPLSGVNIDQKTVRHSPQQKLVDALIGMMAGCTALYEMRTSGCAPTSPSRGPSEEAAAPISRPSKRPSTP
jgi:hypothetical protein